jgi:hypothetical protein
VAGIQALVRAVFSESRPGKKLSVADFLEAVAVAEERGVPAGKAARLESWAHERGGV